MSVINFFKKDRETDVERYQRELNARRTSQKGLAGTALLQVEDIFTITGRGTVVVGQCGVAFGVGDPVIIENPDGSSVESVVAGLEIFRSRLDRAQPGDQVGVLLRGVSKQDVRRGAWLKAK